MNKIYSFLVNILIGRVTFDSIKYQLTGKRYNLSNQDIEKCCELLLKDRFIGLTVRKTHLTTYLIRFVELLLTGKYGYWTHVWINAEDEESDSAKLKLVEAVGSGVGYASFWNILDCDSVVLLRPKWLDEKEWERICSIIPSYIGKKYDNFFNHKNKDKVSCVELIYQLMLDADQESLPNLQRMVEYYGKLTPDMIYSCGDFEIAYEVRK